MEEKKVYVFGTAWGLGGKSLLSKYRNDKVVFLKKYNSGEHDKKFSDRAEMIKKGDIIILRTGNNMRHSLRLSYIGIANSDAKIKKMYSTYPLYEQESNYLLPDTNKDTDAVYITIDKWYNIPDNDDNKVSGMADRIVCINSANKAYNNIIKLYNKIIVKDANKMRNEICELLKNNYNLILTGAPGTGKTYLAKQIAAKMIFGEDISLDEIENDESKREKFKTQYKFVQFHPSYDYTDFVEGIRPVKEDDNINGFKRKDGTFKKFCIKAVNNMIDSKKPVNIISKEKIILQYLDEFSNEILEQINEKGMFELTETSKIYNYEPDNESINFKIINNTNRVKIYNNELIQMYEFYSNTLENNQTYKIKDFLNYSDRKCKHTTYYHNFISAFYNKYGDNIKNDIINNSNINIIKQENFVFVIDEINRGDINKILGELFYAVDPGYRGEKGKVETQYQNLVESGDVFANGFYIPENVYIIGTMNDIDRSVESMDFAIRRRFAWQEIKPEDTADDILKNVKINSAADVLNELNKIIAGEESLGEMYQLGASYFLKLNKYIDDEKVNDQTSIKEAYKKLWDNHLNGLIYEYVRGKKSGNEIFEIIKNKYFKLTDKNNEENNEDTEK